MLSTLFRNLQNHTVVNGGVNFVEDELIDAVTSLDFAAKKEKTCTKGYSCGKTCISPLKNCRNPLEGQARNYAQFLELQSKKPPTSKTPAKSDTPGKKTAIAQKWSGAWDDAPEDLKRVLDIIDEPEEATQDLVGCAYQVKGKIYMHKHTPGTGSSDNTWRHEYGHHLDEKIIGHIGKTRLQEILNSEGFANEEALLNALENGSLKESLLAFEKKQNIERKLGLNATGKHNIDELRNAAANREFVTEPKSVSTLKEVNEAFRKDEDYLLNENAKFKADCIEEYKKEYEKYKDNIFLSDAIAINGIDNKAAIGATIKWLKLQDEISSKAGKIAFEKSESGGNFGYHYEAQKALLLDQKFEEQGLKDSVGYKIFENMPDGEIKTRIGAKMLSNVNSPEAIAQCLEYYLEAKGKKSDGAANDLIGAVTYNKIGFGHSDAYYASNPVFKRNTEAIAQIVSLYGTGDKVVEAALEQLSPNGFKQIKAMFKEVANAK